MTATLSERALLMKLSYENKGKVAAALRELCRLKNLLRGSLFPRPVRRVILQFEKTGDLRVQPGQGQKSTSSDVIEDVVTAIVKQSMDNNVG